MPSWSAVPKSLQAKFPPPPARHQFTSEDEYEDARGYWQSHVGRSISFAMQKHRETPRQLHYRIVPHNNGIVFAEPERASLIAQIHDAIRASGTWGEFKGKMPPEESPEIERWMADEDSEQSWDDADEFSPESIPGWSDGDYPPWLQQEMSFVLPQRVLTNFAEKRDTSVNGSYWHIPIERVDEVLQALRDLGFDLIHKEDSPFH